MKEEMALFTPRIRAIMSGDGGGRRRGETGRAARRGETEGRERRRIDVLMNRLCVDLSAIYSLIRKYLGGNVLPRRHSQA